MKRLLPLIFIFFINHFVARAQAPAIQWAHCYGDSITDFATAIQPLADGGYIMVGYTTSFSAGVGDLLGFNNYYVVRMNDTGGVVWQEGLGGSNHDEAFAVAQTTDGGYAVAGYTYSNDIDVVGNHGGADYWLVKLDTNGHIQWQKCYGGSSEDLLTSMAPTSDGGFILGGYSISNDYDVTGNHGGSDYWIVKVDDTGHLEWQRCLGGSLEDEATAVHQTTDGGYIVGGWTESTDGMVSGLHGFTDYWTVKLDGSGHIQWSKCLGGSAVEFCYDVHQTQDGGYIVAGSTYSTDGDVTGNHGGDDYWIVKLDDTAHIQWQKCYGGTAEDIAYSIQQTPDLGYIIVGSSQSTDGDVTGNHGSTDYWAVKTNDTGGVIWQRSMGGSAQDVPNCVKRDHDGGYLFAGYTLSDDSDVSGYHGFGDAWVIKLGYDGTGVKPVAHQVPAVVVYPNPAASVIHIRASVPAVSELCSLDGRTLMRSGNNALDISALPAATYVVSVYDLSGVRLATEKVIKQ